MQWESWQAFWAMGGAAWYVWGSYGVTALLIVLELVLAWRRPSSTLQKLQRLRRARAASSSSRPPQDDAPAGMARGSD